MPCFVDYNGFDEFKLLLSKYVFSFILTPVEKAVEFVQAEKLFYETALIQAGRKESHGKTLS